MPSQRCQAALVALVALVILTSASCGGGEQPSDGPTAVGDPSLLDTGEDRDRSTTTAPATATPRDGGTGGRSSSTTTAVAGRTATTRRSTGGSGGDDTIPQDDPVVRAATGGPGSFGRMLLRPAPATRLVFERMEQAGAAPRTASVSHAVSVTKDVSGKEVATPEVVSLPGGARDWSASDIRALADEKSAQDQGGGQAVLRVLFLRGTLDGNEQVLGVAVRGDVLAIFSDQVASAETPLVSEGSIEAAVLTHELGHVLGLVDLARDTGRDDPARPGHSSNDESVMFWAVESSLVGQILTGGPPRDFDADDLADLAALRKGA